MTNKGQIQRDIAVAFDFVEQIIDHPELTDKIPEGSVITFIDKENTIGNPGESNRSIFSNE